MSRHLNGNLAYTTTLRMIPWRIPAILLSVSSGTSNHPHPMSTFAQNACTTATGSSSDHQQMEGANPGCTKHLDSNRNCNWNLYNDQEVHKCTQQLINSHKEQSKTDKSLLNLDEHFINKQAMERAHVHYVIGKNYNNNNIC